MAEYDSPPKIVYPEGGGINTGLPATEIEPNERVTIENFYTHGKKIIRRGGIRRVTTTPFLEALTSMVQYRVTDAAVFGGSRVGMIVAGNTSFGRTTAAFDAIVNIPKSTGAIAGTSLPMFEYNGVVYAVGYPTSPPTNPNLYRIGAVVQSAGIAAPLTAPVIAQGAAGALAAGGYYAVYTYFDSSSGIESNPSPPSNLLALASLHKIDYTGIADPGAGIIGLSHIATKRVYRTLLDQVNEYYYVGSVALGATTLTEEVLPDAMGDPVLFSNNLPPNNLRWAAPYNERCFGTDGIDLFFTNLFTMEGWTANIYPVFKDDGHFIRVLFPWQERNCLVIGKTNKVHYLTGTDRATFRLQTMSDKAGVVAGKTMKVAAGRLFWLGDRNVFMSDGTTTIPIGDVKVRKLLDAIPATTQEYSHATVNPSLSQYILAIPDSASTSDLVPRNVLVYNYNTDTWVVYRHPSKAPVFMTEFYDSGVVQEGLGRGKTGAVYGCYQTGGHIYHLYDPTRGYDQEDAGTPIPIAAKVLTRQEDGGTLFAKALRRVHLLCTTAAEVVTLKAFRDGRLVPSASRDVSLSGPGAWKVANLSTIRDPGSTVQVGIEYTGTTAIEIESIGLELEQIERFTGQPQ